VRTSAAEPDTLPAAVDTTGPPADVAGRWTVFWLAPAGPRRSGEIELRQEERRVWGTLPGRGLRGRGTVRGRLLELSGRRVVVPFRVRAAVEADSMRGFLRVLGARRDFVAVRER
jgi:hypothetical protein